MKRKLQILIHSLGMPFDGETILHQSLGGSETAAYYQAKGLAALGHDVTVWTGGESGRFDGVTYTNVGPLSAEYPLGEQFERWAQVTPHDVLIIQRHALAFHKKFAAKICIWQLHDLALHRSTGAIYQGLWQTNAITVVSDWHKRQVMEVWGVKESAIHVVPNGVDLNLYRNEKPIEEDTANGIPDNKFLLLYQSRPERGIENLVREGGIMHQLMDEDVHLLVCGYANTQPAMAAAYDAWDQMASNLPNVSDLGALTKQQLAQVQKRVDLMVYPSTFEEVSCISAMEAMAAGLPMLCSDVGALRETCTGAGVKLLKLTDKGGCDIAGFVKAIRNRIASPESMQRDRTKQLEAAQAKSWYHAVRDLENLITGLIRQSQEPMRLVRHGFEHSDIQIAREAGPANLPSEALFNEYEKYDFSRSEEKYKAHYDKHGGIYYDGHEDKVIGEDVTSTLRFRGVMSLLSQKQDEMIEQYGVTADNPPPMRVLDYGCAHGHYLMQFAKMLPDSEFFGVDINDRAIGAALKWAVKEQITNVTLGLGTLEAAGQFAEPVAIGGEVRLREPYVVGSDVMPQGEQVSQTFSDNRFDVIIAAEVLEHVPDPAGHINALRSMLKPGGYLIGTTPVGRWEWSGTVAFREAREHLWHFEKSDLEEMFAGMQSDILYATAGHDITGAPLGSWVWRIREDKGRDPIQLPPITHRVRNLVPRQTVSACLIVKNGDKTLRACVESFIDWVDEIVIALDPKTTDRTFQIIEWLKQDYPLKSFVVFDGLSATTDGFDAARNATLDKATGDWILWIDADEIMRNPWQMWKFLKDSAIDAFGIGQQHYSADPPKVLTTDYPNRLFRKSCGARFHGLVHEHPETEMGKSIPNVIIRHELSFLHNGYIDETARRARYQRNMPLLVKDVEKNPNRVLNKFLHLRDLSQSVAFDLERTGNQVTFGHQQVAQKCVDLFEAMLDEKQHVRMLIDGLEYYSLCCRVLNVGFDMEAQFSFKKEPFTDLNASTGIKGRFRTREVCNKLILRISEETTRHYESKHL